MDVTVQERMVSFASEYDIASPAGNYCARKAILAINDKIEITSEGGAVAAHIQGRFSPLRSRHDFTFADGRVFVFGCEKLWTQAYKCEGAGESYTLYEHHGLRFSVFKEDRQIAAVTKNRVVIGKGNQYAIRMDSDADVLLIVCMIITINSAEFDDNKESATVDFGNIGPQARKFDESWQPR